MSKITAGPSHPSRYTAAEPAPDNEALVARTRELIADLSPDNADLLTAFHRIQHEYGYVPRETIPEIAVKFRTTPAMIYGSLEFYSEIHTVPPAETVVGWCSGPACLLKGSVRIRRVLESVLECQMNENSEDGAFGLRLLQCDGTCHLAPLVRREGRYIGPLSISDAIGFARDLKGGSGTESQGDGEGIAGESERESGENAGAD